MLVLTGVNLCKLPLPHSARAITNNSTSDPDNVSDIVNKATSVVAGINSVASDVANGVTSIDDVVRSAVTSAASDFLSGAASVTGAVGSAASSLAAEASSRLASVRSDISQDLAPFTTYAGYTSIIAGWESAAAVGTAAAASYIDNLPSSIDSTFRSELASALNSAASNVAPTNTGSGGAPLNTDSPGAGSKTGFAASMVGAVVVLAVALAL